MSFAARRPRNLMTCLIAASALALLATERASAGYGMSPDGATIDVTTDSRGRIDTPATLDLVVYLDAQDSDPYVWVSNSPQINSSGSPVGTTEAVCASSALIPFGEPNKSVCRISLRNLLPGQTYYWWLDFRRSEPGVPLPQDRISGPFTFSLAKVAAPPPPTPKPPVPPPPKKPADPQAGVSTKTVAAAATLPSANVFTGSKSIKHITLTRLVYKTMKQLGAPRALAFACWNRSDWLSVLAAEGDTPTHGSSTLLGFWLGAQPRWLHLAPDVCTDVQALLSTRLANARRAGALAVVIHETLHAYGIRNEAQTNCFAIQLVPYFGLNLGMSHARAEYLGTLARNYVRGHAPPGYWNSAQCRDGGAWDLFTRRNL